MAGGAACEAAGEAGWLAGLPVSIKDLTDVAGVRTTYGSPIFADHVPAKSHPAGRAHRAQGRHRHRQVEHAGVRRRRQHLQRGVRPHAQSLEHLADLRRLDRRRRGVAGDRRGLAGARLRPWRLAAPARHLLLGRGPAAVAGPRDARHSNNLFSPLSVQGPMARNVADLALFLDTMAGLCPQDPHDLRRAGRVVQRRRRQPGGAQARRLHGRLRRQGVESTARSARSARKTARRFEELGCVVEEASPDFGQIDEAFWRCAASSSSSTASCSSQQHRDQIKPDIIWNTELGLKQTPASSPGPSASARRCSGAWSSSSRPTICW